jgi:hypothetical protein
VPAELRELDPSQEQERGRSRLDSPVGAVLRLVARLRPGLRSHVNEVHP